MKPINKSFKEWKKSDLEKYIGLIYQEDFEILQNWLTSDGQINQREMESLQELCQDAKIAVAYWNEQELQQQFISPLIRLVRFHKYEKRINVFAERKLAVTIKNAIAEINLYGMVDWFLATGLQDPEHPFFFIHEYKKEKGIDNDPLGQLLATMVVAQELNQEPPEPTLFNPTPTHFYKDIPIYGAYVMGRFWYFVVLKNANYSISRPYISTELKDLQTIFKILKAQKQITYSYLEEK